MTLPVSDKQPAVPPFLSEEETAEPPADLKPALRALVCRYLNSLEPADASSFLARMRLEKLTDLSGQSADAAERAYHIEQEVFLCHRRMREELESPASAPEHRAEAPRLRDALATIGYSRTAHLVEHHLGGRYGFAVEVLAQAGHQLVVQDRAREPNGVRNSFISATTHAALSAAPLLLPKAVAGPVTAGLLFAPTIQTMSERSDQYFNGLSPERRQMIADGWNLDPDGPRFEAALQASRLLQLPGRAFGAVHHAATDGVIQAIDHPDEAPAAHQGLPIEAERRLPH